MIVNLDKEEIGAFFEKWGKTNFEFCGVNWWPLIRTNINLQYFAAKQRGFAHTNMPTVNTNGKIPPPKIGLTTLYQTIRLCGFTLTKTRNNALFTFNSNKTTIHNGKFINQYTEPFVYFFNAYDIEFDLIEVKDETSKPLNIAPLKKMVQRFVTQKFNKANKFKELLVNLNITIKDYTHPKFDLYENLANQIIACQTSYLTYSWYFKKRRYRTILYYCYYNSAIMGINRAAHKRGIQTIEYQHSQVSREHVAYAGWPNTISKEFFPNTIWAWSAADADNLKLEFEFIPNFKTIIGGNLFIPFYSKTNTLQHNTAQVDIVKILYTLQGVGIPTFIFNYIAQCKKMKWFLRIHPRQPADKPIIMALKELNPDCVEIESANSDPLYKLLSEVDYHLTEYSGTALEAQCFNVTNIIFGSKGYNSYRSMIEDNSYFYITDENELNEILTKRKKSNYSDNRVINDDDLLKSKFQSIFK